MERGAVSTSLLMYNPMPNAARDGWTAVDVARNIEDDVVEQMDVETVVAARLVSRKRHRAAIRFGIAGLREEVLLQRGVRPEHIDVLVADFSKRSVAHALP